jgi:hypothetical protein
MEAWLNPYRSRPVAEFIAKHGPPSTVYDEGDKKVYVWSRDHTRQTPGRVQNNDYGQGVKNQTVYSGHTRTRNYYEMAYVDKFGNITDWKWGQR